MGLMDKLNAAGTKMNSLESQLSSLPLGVRSDVQAGINNYRGMATSLPSSMTNMYDNFTGNIKAISQTAKAVGSLGADPTGDVCGVLNILGSGEFLDNMGAKLDSLLSAIENGASDLEDRARGMLSDLDKAIGLSDTLNDIEDYVNDAKNALEDLGETLGIGALGDILKTARCLQHAAAFTANQSTLLAAQVANLSNSMTPAQITSQLKSQSFGRSGILGKAQAIKNKLADRLGDSI